MRTYTRPPIETLEFRDGSGAVINYGNRWAGLDGPPEDTYSVIHDPERFAPLHTVATAVVEYLIAHTDIDVEEGSHLLAGVLHAPDTEHVVRAVRLTPRSEHAAALTFVWTRDPAIHIHAGVLFSATYPSCACDACDERWDECADQLEEQVFSIVAGGLFEDISAPTRPTWRFEWGRGLVQAMGQTVSYRLRERDGESEQSGQTRAEHVPAAMLQSAHATLQGVHAASPTRDWLPWQEKPRQS